MAKGILIENGFLVNENRKFLGYIIIEGERIRTIGKGICRLNRSAFDRVIDAKGGLVLPGAIDDQVHFREPGLTAKADIATESRAAVAGGVTSFMEMPNTTPPTTTPQALEWKFQRAAEVSMANYSFYFGASNNNVSLLETLDPSRVCGVKVFMGSSTGDLLVDRDSAIAEIFKTSPILVATHCEDNSIIAANTKLFRERYGENLTPDMHPLIRSAEACYASSSKAVELAHKYNTRLHVLHLSTEKEMSLFSPGPVVEKRITAEVCVHHLWFCDEDYSLKGNLIKWNPAIKTAADRQALRRALIDSRIDVVATDHAPHTLEEKQKPFADAPSGGPLVQFSLLSMLQMCKDIFTVEQVVEKMCHNPALLYQIDSRGFLREGYYADIVIVENRPMTVTPEIVLSKCGWSPFEGYTYRNTISKTIVNGTVVYDEGVFREDFRGKELRFNR